jgi:hypothetical protein
VVSRLWGGLTPHPSGHPGSVWDLPYSTWLMFAAAADEYVAKMKEAGHGG